MIATPQEQAEIVVDKLRELGVECSLAGVVVAPQLIRVELLPESKTRMMDFRRLCRADDLAYVLGAQRVRIIAPVPGRSIVAVEFDRVDRQTVRLSDLPNAHTPLLINLGLDVDGRPAILPLADAPHCLVAGQSGSGKTTALHTILAQLISSHTPAQLQLMLIDPKRVELTAYEYAPHLAAPVADNVQDAIQQLRGAVLTMERRYQTLQALGARDIREANEKLRADGHAEIPYAVIVCDELAELMMASGKEVESLLVRLAQKGRAAGIHMVLATQYPVSSVFTGLLRVNVVSRVAFAVPDMTSSRVILDRNGAETLLGKGDGLLSVMGLPPVRFQGAYVSPGDIESVISQWQ